MREPKCSWLWDWMNAQADAHRDRNVSRSGAVIDGMRGAAVQGLVSAIQNAGDQRRPSNHLSQLPEVHMTIVMTILASDNARNRRRARRAEAAEKQQSEQRVERLLTKAVSRCSNRVLNAVNSTDYKMKMRSKPVPEDVSRENPKYRKVNNPYGQITNARQKMRGKSIPLI